MKTLELDFIKRVQAAVDRKERSTSHLYQHKCEKSILLDRFSKFLNGRYFKMKIDGIIQYGCFSKSTITTRSLKTDKEYVHYNYGIAFHLGYGPHEYDIHFLNERLQPVNLTLHYNKILEIEYEEITKEQFYNIVKLFV